MNVHRGQGMQFPTHHGSKAFLNRSIYHARKRLTRLNIRISDSSAMYFVQFDVSALIRGTYALWKFENSARFLTSKEGSRGLFQGASREDGSKNLFFHVDFFPIRAKTAPNFYIYSLRFEVWY